MPEEEYNVCLMNDSFPPVIDGVSNAVVNYASVISNGLGRAVVVTPRHPDQNDEIFPFEIVRYRSVNTEKAWGYRMGYPFSSSKLGLVRDFEPNIIHCHCPFASAVMGRVLREKTNAPLVMTYHTKFDIDIHRAISNKIMAERAIKFVVDNISACDEVWTVSRGAGDNLRSIGYEGDIFVMENGVDFPRGRAPEEKAAEVRKKYNIPESSTLFTFVGRLMWYKGLRPVFDALKMLDNKNLDFRMLLVGDGLEREDMEKYVEELGLSDKVVFAGPVRNREALRAYYTAGDLFLFMSEYDTNGLVVRESAACGVASLLIKGSCASEGIEDGRTGMFCENNAEDVAAKLEFACTHPSEIRQMGCRAMDEVYLSWESAVKKAFDRYPAVVERCMSGRSGRKEGPVTEEFFSVMDTITNNIQRFRSIPSEIKRKIVKK